VADNSAQRTVETVWRMESVRLIAGLVRMVRDVSLAEDLAQDALVAALQQWPESGVPSNPGAWLMTIAKRRAVDLFRRNERLERKQAELERELEGDSFVPDFDAAVDDRIEDDLLRLMFICCHPVLSTEARAALTLRLLAGLTTQEIARAFLTADTTIGQRISRAKSTLAKARVPFEEPDAAERAERLSSVLDVIYLLFNEGYSATAGEDWMRPALCDEALRLGRVLAALTPDEPDVLGLLALMQIQASRSAARTRPDGAPILLLDQDRSRWDRFLIHHGLEALERAESLSSTPGTYVLQAAIAACHSRAATAADTDWHRIATLYAALVRVEPSPIIELNRAVAVSMADGPAAGLAVVDALAGSAVLDGYHLLPSVRGDLLARLGRYEEARDEFERAAAMTRNERERALLLARAHEPRADSGR
jgi:RNA polymerase sigma factor (sigma-70 family)